MSNVNRESYHMSPCYFCNDTIDERYMPEHMQHCGAVLEECPEKCGSYIARQSLKTHQRYCTKRIRENNISLAGNVRYSSTKNDTVWRDNVHTALNILRSSLADSETEKNLLRENLSIAMKRLDRQEKYLTSLRQTMRQEFDEIRQRNLSIESGMKNLDVGLLQTEKRTFNSLGVISSRLESMENCFITEGRTNTKMTNKHEMEIRELTKFVVKENAIVSDLWDDQTKRVNDLKLELEIRCKITRELENKQDLLSEKIDIMVNEIREHADEIRRQRDGIKKLKIQMNDVIKLLDDLVNKDFYSLARKNDDASINNISTVRTNGRLLWRIDRYKEKMTDAKENDTILYSPIFHNKDYGYALRMELLMNGRRQWRGRHIIGCLRVVEGPWDPLLDWPCVLRATVSLRDQENPANDIRKIVKTKSRGLDDKCDSYEKDSGFDMFIPHASLTRYDGFTKNDVMFLDIQITDLKTSTSTSSLIA